LKAKQNLFNFALAVSVISFKAKKITYLD